MAQTVKNLPAMQETWVQNLDWKNKTKQNKTWTGKILWRREWRPTPVFLPGDSHGQRSLAGDSPLGHEELYMTEMRAYTHVMLAIHLL